MTAPAAATMDSTQSYDVSELRKQFPVLDQQVHGQALCYLDNAATVQRPQRVIDAVQHFYTHDNANIHRAVHSLGERATLGFEGARDKLQTFLNAGDRSEIIFVRGVTEGVILVAQSFARPRLQPGDQVLISHMEHHSNLVPWQLVCEQTGAELKVVPITERGEIDLDALRDMVGPKVRMAAFNHVSNALGTINPVAEMIRLCHEHDIPVLLDGAQATPHQRVDVQALDCDFYCVSGHKMYGPTGIGVLYGKAEHLNAMPPYHGGGEMIETVTLEKSTFRELPGKFEAGTPNIAGAIGLGAAVDFLEDTGIERIAAHEQDLLQYALARFADIDGMRMIGQAEQRAAVISFLMSDVHAHDLGTLLNHKGIAIRTGHHCTMPLMGFFGVPATSRVSLACYNTRAEIDHFVDSLQQVRQMFA